jgi:hypothetical protein
MIFLDMKNMKYIMLRNNYTISLIHKKTVNNLWTKMYLKFEIVESDSLNLEFEKQFV